MKLAAQVLPVSAAADERGWVSLVADLVKARLTLLVLLTLAVGFLMGAQGPLDFTRLFHALAGTALLAGGAAALNQFLERDLDARMRRTQTRPLPSGRMQPGAALSFGTGCAVVGLIWLMVFVNGLTALLGALSLGSYLLLYTPLKRVTWWNTLVGAVPGGLPPLMGWAAARGELDAAGWALFTIQAFWQVPHFMAIAWIYRDEYARAGFQMLSVVDPDGRRTARQAVGHTLALLTVGAWPFLLGAAGWLYLSGALALGGLFLTLAVRFARELSLVRARQLFYASLLYLPLVLGLMVLDRR